MANYHTSLDDAFRALADPTRRAVIAKLITGTASVKELAEPFEMGLPSFMKHIKVLEDSGLIHSKKVGRVRTCRIRPEQLAVAEAWLAEQGKIWRAHTDRLAEYAEEQQAGGDAG